MLSNGNDERHWRSLVNSSGSMKHQELLKSLEAPVVAGSPDLRLR